MIEKVKMSKRVLTKGKGTEWVVFCFFAITLAIVSAYHEPWFDEAQAWQIARCSSLEEIMFQIPHYEGHPALWHLMLFLPAKLGFPYEFSMGLMAYIPVFLTGWLIIFRSPFPMLIRCMLPFHYFIFYQHGVVSRPYGYMTLAFMIMAITFKERNDKPWKFMLSMAFLCMLSGYGIVLAGGVALAWTIEIARELKGKVISKEALKDKRVIALFVLLLVAVLLLIQILPYPNTFAFSVKKTNPTWLSLGYSLFVMVTDSCLMSILDCEGMPRFSSFDPVSFCVAAFIGMAFLVICYLYSTNKNRLYFFIPYVLFGIFSGLVYFSSHHLGIIVAFIIFWYWIASEGRDGNGPDVMRIKRFNISEKDRKLLDSFKRLLVLTPIIIPCFWTLVASYNEIRYDYFPSRRVAAFIMEHGMENLTYLTEWGEVIQDDWSDAEYYEHMNAYGLDVSVDPVAVLPYFEHNFCINLNGGDDELAYATHRFASAEESKEVVENLKEQGLPDAIIGLIDLKRIYGDENSAVYIPVYKISPRYVGIWKYFRTFQDSFKSRYIYVRSDLLDKYGLKNYYESN